MPGLTTAHVQEELRQLAAQLEQSYERLTSCRRAPQELAAQVKRLVDELGDRELEIQADVATELTEDLAPKLRYTNETARKAESRVRCARDRAIGQLQAQKSVLESQKLEADLALVQAQDRLKA